MDDVRRDLLAALIRRDEAQWRVVELLKELTRVMVAEERRS